MEVSYENEDKESVMRVRLAMQELNDALAAVPKLVELRCALVRAEPGTDLNRVECGFGKTHRVRVQDAFMTVQL
jgi:hypothetical protein